MAWTEETGGGFSLVEHPMPPRHLAAPLHKHSREDEYSYVVEGRMGAILGDDVVYAEVGDLVFKPRDQWHTFWNAGDEPCRILEIIAPGGFEHFFDELGRPRCQRARSTRTRSRAGRPLRARDASRRRVPEHLRGARTHASDARGDGGLEAGEPAEARSPRPWRSPRA